MCQKICLCGLLLCILLVLQANESTSRITINVPEDYLFIQGAVNAAEDGDIVLVAPGTYLESIDFLGKAITVASLYYTTQDTSYIESTVIDAYYNDCVVKFCNSETSTSVLSGFTLTNGFSSSGGGIYCLQASPMLDHLRIYNCYANTSSGGGIYCEQSNSIQMENLLIRDNTTTINGGGLFLHNCSDVTLSNSEIRNNSGFEFGGGIQCINTTLGLENVLISDNTSRLAGGGIYAQACETITMHNCVVTANTADPDLIPAYSYGGGIYFRDEGELILDNVDILLNTADYGGGLFLGYNPITEATLDSVLIAGNAGNIFGGGIFNSNGNLHISNSGISNNASDTGGGIFFISCQNAYLENIVISNNRGMSRGGGIYFKDSYAFLSNVTITANQSELGGGIFFLNSNPDFSATNLCNIYHNNVVLRGNGNELYSLEPVTIAVDTFTVLEPSSYHITDLNAIDISIQTGLIEQVNADLYVSPDGDDMNSGLTAEEPFRTITHACNCLLPQDNEPRTIHLAEGTYSYQSNRERFPVSLPDNVILEGESQQNVILDAAGSNSVMTFYNTNNCQVSSMILQGGYAEQGGGVYLENSSPVFREVTIRNNIATESGGGIYCDEMSSPHLEKVTIVNNSCSENGGGIACDSQCYPLLINVTMADNQAEMGGGIYCDVENYPFLVNCILWNNLPEQVYFAANQDLENYITIAWSDIEGGEEGIVTNSGGYVNWLTGNQISDPVFLNPETDYSLTIDSPCLDAGTAYFEYDDELLIDLDPDQYYGRRPDMGAWEYENVNIDEFKIENVKCKISNYPNPFNPETTISFSTVEGIENAEISIYNIKGQRLRKWKIENVKCKINQVVWDGRDGMGQSVGSGVYFVSLRSGSKEVMKKIMLLK
ncbi:MAG: right-handed parallel beta-helix repeat-containing protein [Candidatus Cloacimonetes bacterium]|nr:right-handed parallel beta-helix repeat-containing protein [Candidatus Cloacimonadota bacterium]